MSVAALALAAGIGLVPTAGAASVSDMQQQVNDAQSKLNSNDQRAQVISSTIAGFSAKINSLQGGITSLRSREDAVQAKLDSAVQELKAIQSRHRSAETDLAHLRASLSRSRHILAGRLVELYQSDRPDLVTVVLHSDGFAQLLEHKEFLSRIGSQDREIITAVRISRDQTASLATRLATLESRRQTVANEILSRRNEIASVRNRLEVRQQAWADARAKRKAALDAVHADAKKLKEKIDVLNSDIASVTGQLQGASPVAAGPIRAGSGRFIWPVNGPITSPFCERRAWESCHPGVDIGVPSGTPIRAAGSGVIQIAGWEGGYGNYTCIGHGGGVSTCYGHQSRIDVSVGQQVSQGQVIGLVGCTGLCFGDHLHFEVRVNGAVTDPLGWL
jgi:murein DD-endopeptidase MepM/ murein hydrolase activator NlpD